MGEKQLPGFQRPQVSQDNWVANIYQRYELGSTPSLEQIEPIATKLLADIDTAHTGAEMVLGRRVDSAIEKEPEVLEILATPGLSGQERFLRLLLQKTIEKTQPVRAAE